MRYQVLLAAVCLTLACSSGSPTVTAPADARDCGDALNTPAFALGERWSYATRLGEEASTFVVGKVEDSPAGRLVHVRVDDIVISGPLPQSVLPHVTLAEGQLVCDRIERVETGVELGESFGEGYLTWKANADGRAFTVPLSEVVGFVELTLSEGNRVEQ